MPTKVRHETKGATGKNHTLGHFCLKLNFPFERFQEMGEQFYLILTLKPIPKDETIFISAYTELEKSQWIRRAGSGSYFDKIDYRIPLSFKADREGKGYAECSILCWSFNAKYMQGRFATLVYDRTDFRDLAITVCKNIPLQSLHNLNVRLRKEEKALQQKEKRDTERVIFWASAWQPEIEFGGEADLHLWRLPDPLPMVDSHLHIQSNHCAPLPLVWDKLPVKSVFQFFKIGWDTKLPNNKVLVGGTVIGIVGALVVGFAPAVFALGGLLAAEICLGNVKLGMDQVSGLLFGESGKIGSRQTDIIGLNLSKLLKASNLWALPFFSSKGPVAISTPLPMDMHYGHFHGYHGEPIYKMENEKFSFRLNPFTDDRGEISVPDTFFYESYPVQIKKTIKAALDKGWSLLPLFHYDPRRWMESAEEPMTWNSPFKNINTKAKRSEMGRPFIGFKTYTSLGYMPLDPALPHQRDFYSKCAEDGIPIMNHCTTAGMYTHDKPFFYDLWKKDAKLKEKHVFDPAIESLEQELNAHIQSLRTTIVDFKWKEMERNLIQKKIAWFDRHYVFPSAWEPVVSASTGWPKLKICLAHFCGYDFFGIKKFQNGATDPETGMIYGFPKTNSENLPDPKKTNFLIHNLCSLIRPENQVHFDVSFFFITDFNRDAIHNFYQWARAYKGGFLLDRMLWGSDWPLLATDGEKGKYLKADQLKGYIDMNAKEWILMDPELWFRMAVVNPIRFYNLKEIRPHLESIFKKAAPKAFSNPALSMAEIYSNRESLVS